MIESASSASVMPVIFASAFIGIPSFIAQIVNNEGFKNFVTNYLDYTTPVDVV